MEKNGQKKLKGYFTRSPRSLAVMIEDRADFLVTTKSDILYCLLILMGLSLIVTGASATGETWNLVNGSAAYSQRGMHSSLVFNDRMWVIGGGEPSDFLNDTWSSGDGNIWSPGNASAAFPKRGGHTSLVWHDKMWVIGGTPSYSISHSPIPLNDVWYSSDGSIWTAATQAAAFPARFAHTSLVWHDKMWVIGGYHPGITTNPQLNDVWLGNGTDWVPATGSAAFPARDGHSSLVFNDMMWVIAGHYYDGGTDFLLNDTWYSRDGITWIQATNSAAFPARREHASVVFDNKMWVIGGNTMGSELRDVWYTSDGITWIQATGSAAFPERSCHTSLVFQNKMWVIGGLITREGIKGLNDVWNAGGGNQALYSIHVSHGPHGRIEPERDVSVSSGGTQTFTFLPDSEYEVDRVTVDRIEQIPGTTYTFKDVKSDHVIKVTFKKLPLQKLNVFNKAVIGDTDVYWMQRVVNGAIVQGDSIVLQVKKGTHKILKTTVNWQGSVASERVPVVSKEAAESMVKGTVQYSRMYYIKPDSIIFPIKPTPQNPCWVVRSVENGAIIVTVIDAVTGEIVGYGMPPPSSFYTMMGTQNDTYCNLTENGWEEIINLTSWELLPMGYNSLGFDFVPTGEQIKQKIQNSSVAIFYEFAHSHGTSDKFQSGCCGDYVAFTTASDIESWIGRYPKMPFTFLGSCSSMCDTGPGTLSYAFRKGSMDDTAVVGFCGMANGPNDPYDCSICLENFYQDWQDRLFIRMRNGETVKEAFVNSGKDYPGCAQCVRFEGDPTLKMVPVVQRIPDNTLTMELYPGSSTSYHAGDTISLYGVNSLSTITFLILTGPDLDPLGVILTDLSTPAKYGYFTVVPLTDNTWEYEWNTATVTGGTLAPGTYTIHASDTPFSLSVPGDYNITMLSITFKS